jgi:hypothetical protein
MKLDYIFFILAGFINKNLLAGNLNHGDDVYLFFFSLSAESFQVAHSTKRICDTLKTLRKANWSWLILRNCGVIKLTSQANIYFITPCDKRTKQRGLQ